MNFHTHLEDLSNEIFFEIFDYLNIFDIFTGFTLLNKRISSILKSIPLYIIISEEHCRYQIDFLSSHLIHHENQVISIKMYDTIHDDSSIINLLFTRHHFINLKLCEFTTFNINTKLNNVIKQIKSLNKLVIFEIFQQDDEEFNDMKELTQTILTHKSSSLRLVTLQYPYSYFDISNYTFINSNLTSLNLQITNISSIVSVNKILLIMRLCQRIRYLNIRLDHEEQNILNNINVTNNLLSINENSFPILSQLISFKLTIVAIFDIQSVSYILRCLPNLKQFFFHFMPLSLSWSFCNEYIDGYKWKNMFELYLPYLLKFDFHISVAKVLPLLDLDYVINSFTYFVSKYSNWHMIIDRWAYYDKQTEYIIARTSNCFQVDSLTITIFPVINSETFETRSTRKLFDDHYTFCSDIVELTLFIQRKTSNIDWGSSLFHNINYLIVKMPEKELSWWNYLFKIGNEDKYAQQCLACFSHFVHLPNVKVLEFDSKVPIDQWKVVQLIVQSCSNVNELIINTPLLLSSKFHDNLSLISSFRQITIVESKTENIYFRPNFASKFVERFPSVRRIELQVYSFDHCVYIINIFLTRLEHLCYIKICYNQDTLLDDSFSYQYIIKKRRQAFPYNNIDKKNIKVRNNGEVIEICLPLNC